MVSNFGKQIKVTVMNRQIDVDELVADLSESELLPEMVTDIADLIGMDKALKLVSAVGGRDYRIPVGKADSVSEQELIDILGEESARELMAVYGGSRAYIPRCAVALREQRDLGLINAVRQAMAEGMSKTRAVAKLSVQYGMTERWAYQVLKEKSCYLLSGFDEQLDMFG